MGGLGQAAAASCEAHDDEEYVTEEVWAERLAARRLRTGILMMEIWHRHNRTWYPETKRQAQSFLTLSDEANSSG